MGCSDLMLLFPVATALFSLSATGPEKKDKHRQARLFLFSVLFHGEDIDFIFTATSPTRKTSWRRTAVRFWAPPVAQKIPLCHLYFRCHSNSWQRFISVKVSNDCNFHFQWKQSSAVGFIFQSFFSLPSLLCHPVVVEATAVRISSGVAIIYDLVLCPDCEKRLIKHLYLPLHPLALVFTRLWIPLPVKARAACCSGSSRGAAEAQVFRGYISRSWISGDTLEWRTGSCRAQREIVWLPKCRWGDRLRPARTSAQWLMFPAALAAVRVGKKRE